MATPLNMQFTEEDFKEKASYDDLKNNEDYVATLVSVEDAVASTGNTGWAFTFDINGLEIIDRVWHKGGGKWKIREVFNALGEPVGPGQEATFLDPNPLVGRQCVVTIKKEPRQDGDGFWTNIGRHTPYVQASTPTL